MNKQPYLNKMLDEKLRNKRIAIPKGHVTIASSPNLKSSYFYSQFVGRASRSEGKDTTYANPERLTGCQYPWFTLSINQREELRRATQLEF